ncbi:MAG: flagellar FlbD family protein [Oscillospiraceae bacterium]|nr:flagellar FlbD family protein [Oscillospiraceae bacterium]MDY2846652.1 flagellar FlbD family protein [Oscillospiraceae bacterium]
MIRLNRLNNTEILVNESFIEIAEEAPDTVVTMQNGHSFTVQETVNEIMARSRSAGTWARFAKLTRIKGSVILVNLSFLEMAEEVPDTVLITQNSHSYTVREKIEEIQERSENFRKGVFD